MTEFREIMTWLLFGLGFIIGYFMGEIALEKWRDRRRNQ